MLEPDADRVLSVGLDAKNMGGLQTDSTSDPKAEHMLSHKVANVIYGATMQTSSSYVRRCAG